MKTIDENICILPRCEETKLLVDRRRLFCVEHSKRFNDFLSNYQVSSEVDNMLKIDEEFRNEFFTDMIYEFCFEEIEEWYKNNPPLPIKNKKRKKKDKKKSKKQKYKK